MSRTKGFLRRLFRRSEPAKEAVELLLSDDRPRAVGFKQQVMPYVSDIMIYGNRGSIYVPPSDLNRLKNHLLGIDFDMHRGAKENSLTYAQAEIVAMEILYFIKTAHR